MSNSILDVLFPQRRNRSRRARQTRSASTQDPINEDVAESIHEVEISQFRVTQSINNVDSNENSNDSIENDPDLSLTGNIEQPTVETPKKPDPVSPLTFLQSMRENTKPEDQDSLSVINKLESAVRETRKKPSEVSKSFPTFGNIIQSSSAESGSNPVGKLDTIMATMSFWDSKCIDTSSTLFLKYKEKEVKHPVDKRLSACTRDEVKIKDVLAKKLSTLHLTDIAESIVTRSGVTINLLRDISLVKVQDVRSFVSQYWLPMDDIIPQEIRLASHNYRHKSMVLAEFLENMLTSGSHKSLKATSHVNYEFEFNGRKYNDGLVMIYCILFELSPQTNDKLAKLKVAIATLDGRKFRNNYKTMSTQFSILRDDLADLDYIVPAEDLKSYVLQMGRSIAVKGLSDRTNVLEEQDRDLRTAGKPGLTWTYIDAELRQKQTVLEDRGEYKVADDIEKLIKGYVNAVSSVPEKPSNDTKKDTKDKLKNKRKDRGDFDPLSKEYYDSLPSYKRHNPDKVSQKKTTNGTTVYWCPNCHPFGGTFHPWKPEDCKFAKRTLEAKSGRKGKVNATKGNTTLKPDAKKDTVSLEMDRSVLGFLANGDATGFFNACSHLSDQDFQ